MGSIGEARLSETIAAVQVVLDEIGADDVPVELVLNKVDLLDPLGRRRLRSPFPRALQVSAQTGEGLEELKLRIAELFSDRFEDVRMLVPYTDGSALAELYNLGAPIAERRDTPEGVRVRARLPRREIPRFARFLVAGETRGRGSRQGDRRRDSSAPRHCRAPESGLRRATPGSTCRRPRASRSVRASGQL